MKHCTLSTEPTDHLSPSLFTPRSEEDLVRDIIALSSELKYPHDLPHALISFQEESGNALAFNIVLLRIVNPEAKGPTIQELSQSLSAFAHLVPKRVAVIGNLQGKYHKEASLFAITLDRDAYARENHSLDLVKARIHIVEALQSMVGPFMDCSATFSHSPSKEAMHSTPSSTQTIHLQLPRAAQSLDPRSASDRTSGIVIRMLYEGLCRIAPGGKVEMAIAEHIALSPDQLRYTFTLKETYWSNGSPLTAHDFEYAWKSVLDPEVQSPYSFLFFPITNSEAAKQGDLPLDQVGIHATDDHTLVIDLEYPAPFFLELTAGWLFSPMCHAIDQKHPGWAYQSDATYVCNGPFKLSNWKPSDDLRLMRNPLYWDAPKVKLDEIHVTVIPEEKEAHIQFNKGALDWIGDPLSKIPVRQSHDPQLPLLLNTDSEHSGLFWLHLNMQLSPLNNVHIRKALAYALDRRKLIHEVLKSSDVPAFGFNALPEQAYPHLFHDADHKEALLYFEKGLKELNLSRASFPTIEITHSDIEEQVAIMQHVGKQWQDLFGIKVTFKKAMWNAYFNQVTRRDFMVGGFVWYPRYTDPIYFYDLFIPRPYSAGPSTWHHPDYAALITEAKQTLSSAAKRDILQSAEKILIDAMPAIPLFYQHFHYFKNPRLKGYVTSNPTQIDFCRAYLEVPQENS